MSLRPYRDISRRVSRRIQVGGVPVGGGTPITVQSMTNTPTSDAPATLAQVRALEDAGADIVRVSCPDEASTAALAEIVAGARVPIVADIHFHHELALMTIKNGVNALRLNPGNIRDEEKVREVVRAAKADFFY